MQEITLADLFHLPYGAYLKKLDYNYLEDPAKRPNVARYARRAINCVTSMLTLYPQVVEGSHLASFVAGRAGEGRVFSLIA